MAVSYQPIFGKTPLSESATLSVANANRDGTTGTYATVYTFGASGGLITGISIKATVTTTAGLVRIFIDNELIWEEPIAAITVSATQWAFETYIGFKRPIAAGSVITASTERAETFKVVLFGWDYE